MGIAVPCLARMTGGDSPELVSPTQDAIPAPTSPDSAPPRPSGLSNAPDPESSTEDKVLETALRELLGAKGPLRIRPQSRQAGENGNRCFQVWGTGQEDWTAFAKVGSNPNSIAHEEAAWRMVAEQGLAGFPARRGITRLPDERLVLVTEFIPKPVKPPLPLPRWAEMACQLIRTLEGLHDQGWAYVDLSDEHLRCDDEGQAFTLVDLGGARPLGMIGNKDLQVKRHWQPPESYLSPTPLQAGFDWHGLSLLLTLFLLGYKSDLDGEHWRQRLSEAPHLLHDEQEQQAYANYIYGVLSADLRHLPAELGQNLLAITQGEAQWIIQVLLLPGLSLDPGRRRLPQVDELSGLVEKYFHLRLRHLENCGWPLETKMAALRDLRRLWRQGHQALPPDAEGAARLAADFEQTTRLIQQAADPDWLAGCQRAAQELCLAGQRGGVDFNWRTFLVIMGGLRQDPNLGQLPSLRLAYNYDLLLAQALGAPWPELVQLGIEDYPLLSWMNGTVQRLRNSPQAELALTDLPMEL